MHWLKRAPLKEALLLLYLLTDGGTVAGRMGSLGISSSLLVYAALYGMLAGALWVASRLAPAVLRWGLAMLFFAAAAFLGASERILDDHLTYDGFLNLAGSAGFAGDAMAEHGGRIAIAVLTALPLLLAVGLGPRESRLRGRWVWVPLGALAVLVGVLFMRGGDGARGLPTAFAPLAYLVLAAGEGIGSEKERRTVTMQPGNSRVDGDIVLIVDESVAARYLDFVDPAGVRSGLLTPPAGIAVHSFGVAASITNCSLGTNLTLRHGGTRERYAELNASGPAIWDYARKAGYASVYIDAQRTGGGLHNGMDGFDGSGAQWQRYRNAYRNTLLWKVGGFFDRLLAPGTLHGATLIYTADHGQDLNERGGSGVHTHCSGNPVPEEGAVPLAVLTDASAGGGWAGAAKLNRDRASHYQLFPTLLGLMGYAPREVRAVYGESLDRPLNDEMRFNTLFNARLGRKPVWKAIDVATLKRPPASDAKPAIVAR